MLWRRTFIYTLVRSKWKPAKLKSRKSLKSAPFCTVFFNLDLLGWYATATTFSLFYCIYSTLFQKPTFNSNIRIVQTWYILVSPGLQLWLPYFVFLELPLSLYVAIFAPFLPSLLIDNQTLAIYFFPRFPFPLTQVHICLTSLEGGWALL